MTSLLDSAGASLGGSAGLSDFERRPGAPRRARPHSSPVALSALPVRGTAIVAHVTNPSDGRHPELASRLAELGFLPGERVRLVARGALGGPLAVRVGTATFALRREEAACVHVWPGATVG